MSTALKLVRARYKKMIRGVFMTYAKGATPYDEGSCWDDSFYKGLKEDRQTIGKNFDPLAAAYHYASMEAAVVRALASRRTTAVRSMLDLGSGSGHWVQFFLNLYPSMESADACDVSSQACGFLRERFDADPRIRVHNSPAFKFPIEGPYDLVSMLGCAFHIVREDQILTVLRGVASALSEEGIMIFNDLLPPFSYANQFVPGTNQYNKYVRSRRHWRRLAASVGLKASFLRNHAWLRAPRPIPEGHIVSLHR